MRLSFLFIVTVFLFSCKERSFRMPSSTMEGTIMAGESFIVAKSDNFERNDIVVFDILNEDYSSLQDEYGKYPARWQKWVFRLMAISGDLLEIKRGELFVNNKHVKPPPLGKRTYELHSKSPLPELAEKDPYNTYFTKNGDTYTYMVPLTESEADKYMRQNTPGISIEKWVAEFNPSDTFIVKACDTCRWTVDDFGPVTIPSPGQTVIINKANYKLYQHVPGIQTGNNVIKEKLYFVMADNRHAAQDSRYTGFIAHSKMYGVVK